jgi:hypothetical protein
MPTIVARTHALRLGHFRPAGADNDDLTNTSVASRTSTVRASARDEDVRSTASTDEI